MGRSLESTAKNILELSGAGREWGEFIEYNKEHLRTVWNRERMGES